MPWRISKSERSHVEVFVWCMLIGNAINWSVLPLQYQVLQTVSYMLPTIHLALKHAWVSRCVLVGSQKQHTSTFLGNLDSSRLLRVTNRQWWKTP